MLNINVVILCCEMTGLKKKLVLSAKVIKYPAEEPSITTLIFFLPLNIFKRRKGYFLIY